MYVYIIYYVYVLIIYGKCICTPVPQLYEMFGLLPIEKLYSFQVLLLVFKCMHCSHLVPSVHVDRFVINSEMHNYNTRSGQKVHLFNTTTTYGQRCIKHPLGKGEYSLPVPHPLVAFGHSTHLPPILNIFPRACLCYRWPA